MGNPCVHAVLASNAKLEVKPSNKRRYAIIGLKEVGSELFVIV
jgi:hypothetical protein